jgi:hypothetical protein
MWLNMSKLVCSNQLRSFDPWCPLESESGPARPESRRDYNNLHIIRYAQIIDLPSFIGCARGLRCVPVTCRNLTAYLLRGTRVYLGTHVPFFHIQLSPLLLLYGSPVLRVAALRCRVRFRNGRLR